MGGSIFCRRTLIAVSILVIRPLYRVATSSFASLNSTSRFTTSSSTCLNRSTSASKVVNCLITKSICCINTRLRMSGGVEECFHRHRGFLFHTYCCLPLETNEEEDYKNSTCCTRKSHGIIFPGFTKSCLLLSDISVYANRTHHRRCMDIYEERYI